MLSDLTSIDLFTLAVATDWSEEHKKGLTDQYARALAMHLEEKLRQKLTPEQVEKIDILAEGPKTTDETLIEFYKKNIPDMYSTIEQVSLDFKKEFLIKLYDRYCKEFETEIKQLKENFTATGDQNLQITISQKTKAQLHWEHVLHLAKEDKWKEIEQLLAQ